jgi:hypothetical protein
MGVLILHCRDAGSLLTDVMLPGIGRTHNEDLNMSIGSSRAAINKSKRKTQNAKAPPS